MTKILIDKETVELALEALEDLHRTGDTQVFDTCHAPKLIPALRQALEQSTEQEPVAFINVEERKLEWAKYTSWDTPTVVNLPKIPLYTQPQEAATAWDKGYQQGIEDERTSESNIGVAGFNAKVQPARQNPYTQPQEAVPPQHVLMASYYKELAAQEYKRGYADAMNWKVQNHLEHFPAKGEAAPRKPLTDERFELIGHADLNINNIYIFSGYGEEVPEGRTPIYAGYKAAHGITGEKE